MERKTYLERYRVILDPHGLPIELGTNVAGVTYKAEEIESGELVAVELVRSEMLGPAALAQLERDAPKAHELNHPNIARVRDVGLDGEHVVYVREFVDGHTLQEWVASHGPLPAGAVLRIGSQVISALAAAAFHSIRHCSLQPANLMIVPGQTPEGEWPLVKVLNFGAPPPTCPQSGFTTVVLNFGAPPPTFPRSGFTTVGVGNSAQFASPEQLVGGTVDFRSENYSLGCTLWFLLTGAPPATDVSVARFSGVPKVVRRLIAPMIAVDADERPKDPVVLQEQFRDALARIDRRESIGRRFGVPLLGGAARPAAAVAATGAAPIAPAPTPIPVAPAPALQPAAEAATATPASVTHMPRRPVSWKPLALAATLIAIGAIGALVVTNSVGRGKVAGASDSSDAIGVPIGVPEASTTTTVANTSSVPVPPPAPANAPQVASTGSAPASAPATSAAPATGPAANSVAASGANAAPAESPNTGWSSAIVSADQAPPPVAESTTQASVPSQIPPPTVVASNTAPTAGGESEAASPAEGPAEVAPQAPAPAAKPATVADAASTRSEAPAARTAEASPARSTAATTAQRKATASAAAPTASPGKTTTTAAKPAKTKPKREERSPRVAQRVEESELDESSLPPVPRGSRRARYIGTRPDGSMIFALPSSERVYAAPPTDRFERSPRRRLRQLLDPDPLPPEEGDEEEEFEDEE